MGCTTSSAESQLFQPNGAYQLQLFKDYAPFGRLQYSVNVNHKYSHLYTIDTRKHWGGGIRQTFAYTCHTTKAQWQRYRTEFWQTRTHGCPQIWKAFRNAVEAKTNEQAVNYLYEVKVKLILKKITLAIDRKGIRYELPVFVVNLPMAFSKISLAQRDLDKEFNEEELQIVIRSVAHLQDKRYYLSNEQLVEQLKTIYKNDLNKQDKNVRFFYNGRQLIDNYQIGRFNFISGQVIQSMIC